MDEIDRNMLEKVFAEHRSRLPAFARLRIDRALAAKLDADEILAEVFVRAASRLDDLRQWGVNDAYPWLKKIVQDCIIDAHRYYHSKRRNILDEQRLPAESASRLLGLVGPATTPSNAAARRELEQRLAEVLAQLTPKDRTLLMAVHIEGLSFREAGQALQITEAAARQRNFRVLKLVRELWARRYGSEGEMP